MRSGQIPAVRDTVTSERRLRRFARAHGILLAGTVFITQFVAIYPIADRYGPDASYDILITAVVRCLILWLPLGTLAGFGVDRFAESPKALMRGLTVMWIVSLLATAVLLVASFREAEQVSESRQRLPHQIGSQP